MNDQLAAARSTNRASALTTDDRCAADFIQPGRRAAMASGIAVAPRGRAGEATQSNKDSACGWL